MVEAVVLAERVARLMVLMADVVAEVLEMVRATAQQVLLVRQIKAMNLVLVALTVSALTVVLDDTLEVVMNLVAVVAVQER